MLSSSEFVGGPSGDGRDSGDSAGRRACVGPGGGGRRRRGGSNFGVRQPVVLFPFHPTVLKPDFNLPLGEDQSVRDLNAPPPG